MKVYNNCRFDIGVIPLAGPTQARNIPGGGNHFIYLTVDDILHIESNCSANPPFAKKKLIIRDENDNIVELSDLNMMENPVDRHYTDDEIVSYLKKNMAQFTAWVNQIEDPAELYAVYTMAMTLDLPASKLKVLRNKMPNRDFLEDDPV